MESLQSSVGAPSSRRDFFKRAGVGVGVLASASALQSCDSGDEPTPPGVSLTLDFSNDVGVLNYAYALEQLEAAFYAAVISDAAFTTAFSGTAGANGAQSEQDILRDIAAHEAVHADFLKAAIAAAGGTPLQDLTPDFSLIDFTSRASVLTTAQTFEDLGVSAYNGAGRYITNDDYLTIAGKIVSVEARHASIISGLITANAIAGVGQINPANGLDRSRTPAEVLRAANNFIVETLNADLP